ncbi:uncharacterized protein LOC142048889 isoform X1 [Phalacrocorax aristotelis]|uniref:uncharacterized protein LOC142048889 isoform X1 n=2 Tax=Phalacrocorax aristotelis TaxID=126867 RepID=UPI003F4C672E
MRSLAPMERIWANLPRSRVTCAWVSGAWSSPARRQLIPAPPRLLSLLKRGAFISEISLGICWKMDAVQAGQTEPAAPRQPEAQERPNRRTVDRLSPELRTEKYVLLSMDGKLLGPELSRIRSEMALPLERPQDLPSSYLRHQRRSLPTLPLAPGPQTPAELRSSSDVLCAGRFPAGLSQLVTGMQTPVSPRRRGSPSAPESDRGDAGR